MLTDGTTIHTDALTADQNTDLAAPECAANHVENCDAPLPSDSPKTLAQANKKNTRKCIATKQSYDSRELIRFVLSPDNIVTPDFNESLPGRGAWVKPEKTALSNAIKHNLFAKSFKSQATVPDNLLESIGMMLNARCLSLLNLARRSGDCIVGFDKAITAAKKLPIALYITASEEGTDSRRKIENTLPNNAEVITIWDADTLSKNFGTENTNHIVIKRSGIANKILKEYRKLYAVIV